MFAGKDRPSRRKAMGRAVSDQMLMLINIGHASPVGVIRLIRSNNLIVQPEGNTPSIGVFPNAMNPPKPLFACTSSMAEPCGDGVVNVAFDPSDKFLFVSDDATGTTPILRVDTAHKKLEEMSTYLPGSTTPVFSHDGRMVYTIPRDSKTVMSTTFNPAIGELGANSSLPIPIGSAIFAW
jgi:hypothetical protein